MDEKLPEVSPTYCSVTEYTTSGRAPFLHEAPEASYDLVRCTFSAVAAPGQAVVDHPVLQYQKLQTGNIFLYLMKIKARVEVALLSCRTSQTNVELAAPHKTARDTVTHTV